MANKAFQIEFSGKAADEDFYGDVVSLTVEESTTAAGTLHLQIALRLQEDGTWTYLDDDRLALFNQVTVKVGFADGGGLLAALGSLLGGSSSDDGLKTVFDGFITDVDVQLGSEPDDAFINLAGMDASVMMSVEEKVATWPDMSDSDIVQQIMSSYGIPLQADTTATVHQETDTTIVQRGTDIQLVRDLAQKNGMEFYLETRRFGNPDGVLPRTAVERDAAARSGHSIRRWKQSAAKFSAHLSGQRPLSIKAAQMDVNANSANVGRSKRHAVDEAGCNGCEYLDRGPVGHIW